MENCDGLKTGYTRSAGFCLTATALRDNIRLIAVVMGADAKRDRFTVTARILEDGFKEVVHLSFTSIFSYLLKFLLLNLQQHDRFVDDITEVDFGCATSHTEHFIS